MKTRTEITEITHDDLVKLFADSTYGSSWLSISSNAKDLAEEGDCREDVWAKTILAGREIHAHDYLSEGCVYGNLKCKLKKQGDMYGYYEYATYTFGLEDVKNGLQKCLDSDDSYIKKCVLDFMDDDSSSWDITEAESLMQIILFGELIYG